MIAQLSWRLRAAAIAAAVTLALVVGGLAVSARGDDGQGGPAAPVGAPGQPFRAFSADSYWNQPLPPDAPVHPQSGAVLDFLAQHTERRGCVQLSGAGNDWGMPVYWARPGDPEYAVQPSGYPLPPEFGALRIPDGARPHAGHDLEMVVYDLDRGYVAFLHRAEYDPSSDQWSAGGGSVAYLASNGLAADVAGADDPQNTGSHRGLNGAVVAARHDEVQSGSVDHVLKIATVTAADQYLWPMSGTDGTGVGPGVPVQGMRLRIRPDVDLSRLGLHPEALVIARTLQEYGAIVGDSTSYRVELKLEDTVAEGRGQLWRLDQHSLCAVPIEAFEVVVP